jgi:hypothetical protein
MFCGLILALVTVQTGNQFIVQMIHCKAHTKNERTNSSRFLMALETSLMPAVHVQPRCATMGHFEQAKRLVMALVVFAAEHVQIR